MEFLVKIVEFIVIRGLQTLLLIVVVLMIFLFISTAYSEVEDIESGRWQKPMPSCCQKHGIF